MEILQYIMLGSLDDTKGNPGRSLPYRASLHSGYSLLGIIKDRFIRREFEISDMFRDNSGMPRIMKIMLLFLVLIFSLTSLFIRQCAAQYQSKPSVELVEVGIKEKSLLKARCLVVKQPQSPLSAYCLYNIKDGVFKRDDDKGFEKKASIVNLGKKIGDNINNWLKNKLETEDGIALELALRLLLQNREAVENGGFEVIFGVPMELSKDEFVKYSEQFELVNNGNMRYIELPLYVDPSDITFALATHLGIDRKPEPQTTMQQPQQDKEALEQKKSELEQRLKIADGRLKTLNQTIQTIIQKADSLLPRELSGLSTQDINREEPEKLLGILDSTVSKIEGYTHQISKSNTTNYILYIIVLILLTMFWRQQKDTRTLGDKVNANSKLYLEQYRNLQDEVSAIESKTSTVEVTTSAVESKLRKQERNTKTLIKQHQDLQGKTSVMLEKLNRYLDFVGKPPSQQLNLIQHLCRISTSSGVWYEGIKPAEDYLVSGQTLIDSIQPYIDQSLKNNELSRLKSTVYAFLNQPEGILDVSADHVIKPEAEYLVDGQVIIRFFQTEQENRNVQQELAASAAEVESLREKNENLQGLLGSFCEVLQVKPKNIKNLQIVIKYAAQDRNMLTQLVQDAGIKNLYNEEERSNTIAELRYILTTFRQMPVVQNRLATDTVDTIPLVKMLSAQIGELQSIQEAKQILLQCYPQPSETTAPTLAELADHAGQKVQAYDNLSLSYDTQASSLKALRNSHRILETLTTELTNCILLPADTLKLQSESQQNTDQSLYTQEMLERVHTFTQDRSQRVLRLALASVISEWEDAIRPLTEMQRQDIIDNLKLTEFPKKCRELLNSLELTQGKLWSKGILKGFSDGWVTDLFRAEYIFDAYFPKREQGEQDGEIFDPMRCLLARAASAFRTAMGHHGVRLRAAKFGSQPPAWAKSTGHDYDAALRRIREIRDRLKAMEHQAGVVVDIEKFGYESKDNKTEVHVSLLNPSQLR